jgi:hypothetical protein
MMTTRMLMKKWGEEDNDSLSQGIFLHNATVRIVDHVTNHHEDDHATRADPCHEDRLKKRHKCDGDDYQKKESRRGHDTTLLHIKHPFITGVTKEDSNFQNTTKRTQNY